MRILKKSGISVVMAEVDGHVSESAGFWTKTDMDTSTDSDSYVPGVSLNRPGNMRPRMHGRKTPEVKTKIPLNRPMEDLPTGLHEEDFHDQQMQAAVSGSSRNHRRTLSFKDLRHEDKQRVANLIKELARIGEEKEKIVNQLHGERQKYENQILQLVEQQEQILNEREEIQKRFFDSQRLLNKYQGELLEEQGKQNPPIITPAKHSTWDVQNEYGESHTANRERFLGKKREKISDENHQNGYVEICTTDQSRHLMQEIPVDNYDNDYVEKCMDRQICVGETELRSKPERSYTEQIDREIAVNQYSNNNLPRTADLIQVEPLVAYRPQRSLRYPKNPVKSRPFRDPILSSTQKSSVIEEISLTSLNTINSDFQPLRQDDSSNSLSTERDFRTVEKEFETKGLKNHVGFIEPKKCSIVKLHSPCLEKTNANNDQEFIKYYKKLSSVERKQKLLEQKAALLEEQKRLKEILIVQERQLCEKQSVLKRRHLERKKCLEKQLNDVYREEKNKIAISPFEEEINAVQEIEEQDFDNLRVQVDLNKATYVVDSDRDSPLDDLVKRLDYSVVSDASQNAREIVEMRSRISAATSPIATTQTTVGTSPLRMEELGGSPLFDKVDAGTSVSYRHISRTPPRLSPKQSNLPLSFDDPDVDSPVMRSNSPVEKRFSILEIVDSIQDEHSAHEGRFDRRGSSGVDRNHSYREHSFREQSFREQSFHQEVDEDENLEESRILEEIFFLK